MDPIDHQVSLENDGIALKLPPPLLVARAFHSGTGDHVYTFGDPAKPFRPGGAAEPYTLTVHFNHEDSPMPRVVAQLGLRQFVASMKAPAASWNPDVLSELDLSGHRAVRIVTTRHTPPGRLYQALWIFISAERLIHIQGGQEYTERSRRMQESDFKTITSSLRIVTRDVPL